MLVGHPEPRTWRSNPVDHAHDAQGHEPPPEPSGRRLLVCPDRVGYRSTAIVGDVAAAAHMGDN